MNNHGRDIQWWQAILLLAALGLFGFACGSVAGSQLGSDDADAEPTTTTTTEAVPAEEVTDEPSEEEVVEEAAVVEVEANFELVGELDLTIEEINDMVAFVEESAGREFLRPPRIEMQTIADFEAGLIPDAEFAALMAEGAESNARLYQALGYTGDGVDQLAANLANLGQSTDFISGRYDPADDAVYIPQGALVGDDFNAILVHELLHALDGQHVDLEGLLDELGGLALSDVATDEAFAIAAVVEGRATAVQFEWMMANNVIPSQTEIPEVFDTVPAAAINAAILPYQLGAQSIMELGGPAETWHLYDEFPASSEQMVFPARIGKDEPVAVEPPVVEGEVFFEGVNGVEGMLVLGLGDNFQPEPAQIFETLGAAEGWGGDYFVLSGDENESCLTGTIVADTPEDLAEIEAMFKGWSEREMSFPVTRTAVVAGEALTISSCAPFTA